jgi:hypothetical protein
MALMGFVKKAIWRLRLRIAFSTMKKINESIHPRERRKQFWSDFLKREDFRSFSIDHFYRSLK